MIDRIIDAIGLINAIEVETPTEYGALRKDKDGESCNAGFNYLSIVGGVVIFTK